MMPTASRTGWRSVHTLTPKACPARLEKVSPMITCKFEVCVEYIVCSVVRV